MRTFDYVESGTGRRICADRLEVACEDRAMNMGGPGDHWRTDIFSWDRPAFGEPVDSLVREIYDLGGHALLEDDQPLGRRLSKHWPRWKRVSDEALSELASDLVTVRDRLRAEAVARGWEVE